MSKKTIQWTKEQREVINSRGSNLLVSASAGSGKTAVMIETIATLIEQNADVSEMVVVTFTNLAAEEMKARLGERLAANRQNPHVLEQLEKIDSANICTLHSFCNDLLRNYFYVVDIDPAFAILDDATVATLKRNALGEVLQQYFAQKDDDVFRRTYKIFATGRSEANFTQTLLKLYEFSRCLADFDEWYAAKRANYAEFSENNPFVNVILNDIAQSVGYWQTNLADVAERAVEAGLTYANVLRFNADKVNELKVGTFVDTLNALCKLNLEPIPKQTDDVPFEDSIRNHFDGIFSDVEKVVSKYSKLIRGQDVGTLWEEMQSTVAYTDKLVEMLKKFQEIYFEAKKQRGGLDYDDLEHLCLQLLDDEATLNEVRSRYKLIFVDEYQDTNPVQEAIINRLATGNNLFMVGDIKQSIYGFRGCEPSIFVGKYDDYKMPRGGGKLVELNDNFRSNHQVLDFVNDVFNRIMTPSFGKVNYRAKAQLNGSTPPSLQTFSARVDYLLKPEADKVEIAEMYDLTAPTEDRVRASQGELIAKRIKEYVGMVYYDKDDTDKRNPKHVTYGDIVILMRGLTNKAVEIYNVLAQHNIPVVANFKLDGLASKEVRELVNLFRAIDNPYVDVSFVGTALSVFGGFTESELGQIRLECDGRDVPVIERMQRYVREKKGDLGCKIRTFLDFLQKIRFYSRSASVDEVALKVLKDTDYHLYVQGLPNGALRIKKLYAFIDGLKGAAYAQSIDKFLAYVDETDSVRPTEGIGKTNAVSLMTMHASKGLEFPVVIVAGLESPIQFDRHSVEKCFELGLATHYYNFANMRKAETLSLYACRLFNQNKQREEELRLLYVAMTRAKFALDVVATVSNNYLQSLPKLPSKANSMLDWVYLATRDMMTTNTLTAGLEIEEHKEVALDDDQTQKGELKCKQENDAKAIEERISYVYHKIDEVEMPSKIVSSALDKEYVDATDEPQPEYTLNDNGDRNLVGTAYHKVLQYAPFGANIEQIEQTIAFLAANGKIEQRFVEKLDVQLVYKALHNEQLIKMIDGGEIHHEIPFMLNVKYSDVAKDKRFSDEVMLQGVIDLLVIKGDKAVVVDFKYTARSDLVEERYTAQLNSYKLAVERICGITDVETYVLSIADNKLIKM